MREYNGARLYKFYFAGIKIPVIIEAFTSEKARDTIEQNWEKLDPVYQNSYIIGETVTVPVEGITTKKINNVEYTWVGYEKTRDGWQDTASLTKEAKKYEEIQKIYKID